MADSDIKQIAVCQNRWRFAIGKAGMSVIECETSATPAGYVQAAVAGIARSIQTEFSRLSQSRTYEYSMGERSMTGRRLQAMYVFGILLNAGALIAAATNGATLYAVTFGIVMCYLGVRFWMVRQSYGAH